MTRQPVIDDFSSLAEYLPILFWISGKDEPAAQLTFRNVFTPVKETVCKGQKKCMLNDFMCERR